MPFPTPPVRLQVFVQIADQRTVRLLPLDSGYRKGLLNGTSPVWTPTDPAIVSVTPSADGMSAVLSGLAAGDTDVTVTAVGSAGSNITIICHVFVQGPGLQSAGLAALTVDD